MPSVGSLLTSWGMSSRSTLRPAFSSVSARPFSETPSLGLAEDAPDHRLVARLQALRQHGVGGQRAAGIEVDAGIAEAFGTKLLLQIGQRSVAVGDHDPLVDGLLDEVMKRNAAGMPHDLNAVGLGGHRFLELVDHSLRLPLRELGLQLDSERLGGFLGAGLTGEGRAVAGVAAHLHVHDEALADRVG